MATLRKIDDELEARALLAQVEAAGGSIGLFARAHGIDGRSLHAWKVNLERGRRPGTAGRRREVRGSVSTPNGLRLVELVSAPLGNPRARYTLRVGGAEIEVDDDFREDTLRRILGLLGPC